MAETNRKFASERIKKKNPMSDPDARKKMSETLKIIGHKPSVQRGNGRGTTIPQNILLKELEHLEPKAEYVVKTNQPKYNVHHLPSHYKIDIAIPRFLVAIEIDGRSHCAKKIQTADEKKTAFLKSRGWTVLRFTNAQILSNEKNCVQMVMSTISKLRETTTILQTAT